MSRGANPCADKVKMRKKGLSLSPSITLTVLSLFCTLIPYKQPHIGSYSSYIVTQLILQYSSILKYIFSALNVSTEQYDV